MVKNPYYLPIVGRRIFYVSNFHSIVHLHHKFVAVPITFPTFIIFKCLSGSLCNRDVMLNARNPILSLMKSETIIPEPLLLGRSIPSPFTPHCGQVKSSTRKHLSTSNVKGQPNLTAAAFCFWVNEELLPNACLEPGFPRKTSVETVWSFIGKQRWLLRSVPEFLKQVIEVGFLHPDQAPTPEAQRAFPCDVPLPSSEVREKTVVIFHDESTFNANDDQST